MLSSRFTNLHPYVPGEQPKDRVYVKLNANENPYPPHPSVGKAVSDFALNQTERLGLYPDPDANELRQEIAAMLNKSGGVLCRAKTDGQSCSPAPEDKIPFEVTPDMIFCGNGSDEVLSFVFYSFFDSDRKLVFPTHTYSFYPVYCGYYDIPMDQVPLKDDWTLDRERMLEDANKFKSSIIFANPNAPTGISLSRKEVEDMLDKAPKDRVFIVDEAYCDFGGESCIPLLKDYKNLVIVRTFSKSLSFAGMRLGYVVANPDLIQAVFTAKNSFNHFPVDNVAQTAAIASCRAVSYYAETSRKVVEQRELFTDFLKKNGWFVIDSKTNFVFARKQGHSGQEIYQHVKQNGILIRHFNTPGIEDFVRITIGTPEQMTALEGILAGLK